jgi:hypothetical protein
MIVPGTKDDFIQIYEIINDAASAYKGIIPEDRWHEPYMSETELQGQIDDGVTFWCYVENDIIIGVMGFQDKGDVTLIRHAYVRTTARNKGIGLIFYSTPINRPSGSVIAFQHDDPVGIFDRDDKCLLIGILIGEQIRDPIPGIVFPDRLPELSGQFVRGEIVRDTHQGAVIRKKGEQRLAVDIESCLIKIPSGFPDHILCIGKLTGEFGVYKSRDQGTIGPCIGTTGKQGQ